MKYLLNFCLLNSAWYYGLVLERSRRQSIMQKRLVKPELIFSAPLFVCLFVFSVSPSFFESIPTLKLKHNVCQL